MYEYATERPKLFTEEGQVVFLQIRDKAHALVEKSGAVMMSHLVTGIRGGNSWQHLACVDRLVELGELQEVTQNVRRANDRVFVKPA